MISQYQVNGIRVLLISNKQRRFEAAAKALREFPETVIDSGAAACNTEDLYPLFEKADLVIVAGWPNILPKKLFDLPEHGVWNCHGGPLPHYRGGSPLNWQLINGERKLGVSLIQMDEGIDTGPIIGVEYFELPEYNIVTADKCANEAFYKLVSQALRTFLEKGGVDATPQGDGQYYRQRCDDDGEIDFSKSADEIRNFVNALSSPYPGAWFRAGDGKKVRVFEVKCD